MTDQVIPSNSLRREATKRKSKTEAKIAADRKVLTHAIRVNKEIRKLEDKILALKASPHYLNAVDLVEKQMHVKMGEDELAKIKNKMDVWAKIKKQKGPPPKSKSDQKVSASYGFAITCKAFISYFEHNQ